MDRIVPAKIKAGLTFSELKTLTGYPAPDWVLSVVLRGPAVIDLTGTAEGSQHRLAATATATAGFAPGHYAYSARVARGDVVVEVDFGTVEVLADLSQSSGGQEVRSHARIVLDNIRAVIENRATQDQQKYTIETSNGRRELWRTPLPELLQLETLYAARVSAEHARANGKNIFGRQVRMRLG